MEMTKAEYQDVLTLAALVIIVALVVFVLWKLLTPLPKESSRDSWLRWRACTRKRAYSTRKEARAVVGRHRREGDVVEEYQCRWCRRWHVGHPSPLRRK
jgi:hypothetical protein